MRHIYPHLVIQDPRGNIGTRLSKLDNDEYDGIILAMAALKRLDIKSRIRIPIPPEDLLPAVGQGAIGIKSRIDDYRL